MTYEEAHAEAVAAGFNEKQIGIIYGMAYDRGHAWGEEEINSIFSELIDEFSAFVKAGQS